MEVCSTTLQFCTSSAPQRDNWSCYRRKSLANTLLQNYNIIVPFHSKFYYPMNLHYSKTLHRLLKQLLEFYYPMNLHYSKTSKEDIWSCYQCMYHRTFNCILLYHFPFFRKNILTTIIVQICSNYPAILHLFKCLNRHLKLLPAQNARNYTTPKLI